MIPEEKAGKTGKTSENGRISPREDACFSSFAGVARRDVGGFLRAKV